jgi:hypothetical protein
VAAEMEEPRSGRRIHGREGGDLRELVRRRVDSARSRLRLVVGDRTDPAEVAVGDLVQDVFARPIVDAQSDLAASLSRRTPCPGPAARPCR